MTDIKFKQGVSLPAGYGSTLFRSVIPYSCLIFILLISASCGKKNPPTLKAYEKPDAPLSLSAVHREESIILSWAYPAGRRNLLKGFNILKSDGSGFKGIGFVANDSGSYIDGDCREGNICQYKVVALSLTGILSNESNVITLTPQPLPRPPRHISFTLKNDFIELSWSSSGNGVCYNIYRTMDKGKYNAGSLNREPVCGLSYRDNVFPDLTVYYSIRPLLAGGVVVAEGPASAGAVVAPSDFIPSPPSGLRFAQVDDKVYLTWQESPEVWVRGYRVFRMTGDDKDFNAIGVVGAPSFTDTAGFDKKVWYMIRALGPVSESLPLTGEIPAIIRQAK